jgi:hypothetical protein
MLADPSLLGCSCSPDGTMMERINDVFSGFDRLLRRWWRGVVMMMQQQEGVL